MSQRASSLAYAPSPARRRNCDIVIPVRALKTRLKWFGDSKPTSSGISSMVVSLPESSYFAFATLAAAISSVSRMPNTFA